MTELDLPSFTPCRGLASAHWQTLIATCDRPRVPYQAAQHVVALEDGDAVVLHDDCPEAWQPGDRVALMLHGVAGCHQSPYLVRTAHKLNRHGVRTFRMDLRGMGAGRHLAQHPGHAGRSHDALAAIHCIGRLCPDAPVALVGFSMGGNIVLKLLGEQGSDMPATVDRAMAVAPPIDLLRCVRNLCRGLPGLYGRMLTRMLVRTLQEKRHLLERLPRRLSCTPRRLWDFDDWVTAPLSGFQGAEAYYAGNSAAPLLKQITVPTAIISSEDDPLIPPDMFAKASLSSWVRCHITARGGHVGFFGRPGQDADRWWLDWRVVEWVLA